MIKGSIVGYVRLVLFFSSIDVRVLDVLLLILGTRLVLHVCLLLSLEMDFVKLQIALDLIDNYAYYAVLDSSSMELYALVSLMPNVTKPSWF